VVAGPAPDALRRALADRSLALERELGHGGMAVVYLARDLRHDRLVAVKVLRPGIPAGAERFVREIKLTSPLVHPHIVPVFDSGVIDGTPFFVMPYIEGESLRRRLAREGRLPVADALGIAAEIAEALEFAHGRGVLHRDIKPENVLLQAGHALVADFGVARALSEAAAPDGEGMQRLTDQQLVLGTAEYMSPEQASGDRGLDGRSDLYSLGCVLYEMLTGQPPFTGTSAREIMARRFREAPRPVRELRPEVTAGVAAVLATALAADPAERFSGVTEFLAALRAPDRMAPAAAGRRRWRWLLPGAAAVALAALVLYGEGEGRRALEPRRVVVARLSNETGDTALSYLGSLAADRLTASLAGIPGLEVATSARVIPSRLTTGLRVDSLDDPSRLRTLAVETAAGTIVSGSYFRTDGRILFQAEITDANDGTLLAAVGPVGAALAEVGTAVDALSRGVGSVLRRRDRGAAEP
jgi:serine/threonine-protein kinase